MRQLRPRGKLRRPARSCWRRGGGRPPPARAPTRELLVRSTTSSRKPGRERSSAVHATDSQEDARRHWSGPFSGSTSRRASASQRWLPMRESTDFAPNKSQTTCQLIDRVETVTRDGPPTSPPPSCRSSRSRQQHGGSAIVTDARSASRTCSGERPTMIGSSTSSTVIVSGPAHPPRVLIPDHARIPGHLASHLRDCGAGPAPR